MRCESCGYNNEDGASKCLYCGSGLEILRESNMPAFLTCGDMFDIRGEVYLMGVAVNNLSVADTIKIGEECFTIKSIRVLGGAGMREVPLVEKSKNCALNLGSGKTNKFKQLF